MRHSPVTRIHALIASMALTGFAAAGTLAAPAGDQGAADRMIKAGVVKAQDGKFDGDKPVTRGELVVVLDRWAHYVEEGRKPLHRITRPKPVLPKSASADVKKAANELVTNAFIPADSVLFQGTGSEAVTASQLTDIMTHVVVRVMDRSVATNEHTPD